MKRLRKPLSLLFCAFFLLLTGCQAEKGVRTDAYEYVVGVSLPNIWDPWLKSFSNELETIVQLQYPNTNVVLKEASFRSEKQIEDMEQLLQSGIDLLVAASDGTTLVEEKISEISKELPVIEIGNHSACDCAAMICYDDYAIGQLAGEYIATQLYKDGQKLLVIQGKVGTSMSDLREQGFRDAVSEAIPSKDILYLEGNWHRDLAAQKMKEYLLLHHKPDIVFACNDEMAYGAYLATKEWRLSEIQFIGADGFSGKEGGLALTDAGILSATVSCSNLAQLVTETAEKLLKKQPAEHSLLVPQQLYTGTQAEK